VDSQVPSGSTGLTQNERRRQSERALVDAAIAIVAESGVGALTFEAIGEKSGYSRGLVTQRFGSKRGLIDAMIEQLHGEMQTMIAARGIEALPGLEAVLSWTDLYLREVFHNERLQTYFKLLAASVADDADLRSAFAQEHERVKAMLAHLIRKGQTGGSIRPEVDINAVATMIGSLQIGISTQRLVDPKTALEPLLAGVMDSLRQTLARNGAPTSPSGISRRRR
jgi:AcrR family transcriptional regulator